MRKRTVMLTEGKHLTQLPENLRKVLYPSMLAEIHRFAQNDGTIRHADRREASHIIVEESVDGIVSSLTGRDS